MKFFSTVIYIIFFFLIAFGYIPHYLNQIKVQEQGQVISLKIVEKRYHRRASSSATLEYNNQIFEDNLSRSEFEQCAVGDSVKRKYLDGMDMVVAVDENPKFCIFAAISFLVLLLICIYCTWFPSPTLVEQRKQKKIKAYNSNP